MAELFDATLTGSDSTIDGTVQLNNVDGFGPAYEFTSIDNTLHLIIAKDAEGNWMRVAGTEPYFTGWVDELAEQITIANQQQF
ncbi:hypothetical protein EOD41_11425 [Mucilaginibacter limnophilus]|uniref:Uncharacterized protein n=1 Tax=Mucilaginibacter limnophilus TaxID=1932778 RepID=A0A3S2V1C0_9SPHI|nr:hypothetical protein [Mucilaginibacter limnophilus]RVU00605.1 hypothetical protein EOD41_11425 [Mucilaginibacter limnophilus]